VPRSHEFNIARAMATIISHLASRKTQGEGTQGEVRQALRSSREHYDSVDFSSRRTLSSRLRASLAFASEKSREKANNVPALACGFKETGSVDCQAR